MSASSDEHPPEHDEFLADVLAGDRPIGSAGVNERLAACRACRVAVAEMGVMLGELARLSEQHRADVAQAIAGRGAAEEALMRQAWERQVRPQRARVPIRWRIGALAALLAVAVALWLRQQPAPPQPIGAVAPAEIALGGDDAVLQPLTPIGRVARFDRFVWQCDRQPGWTFVVVVSDPNAPDTEYRSGPLVGLEWTPSPEQRDAWPARIRWLVEAYPPGQAPVISNPVDAWLRP